MSLGPTADIPQASALSPSPMGDVRLNDILRGSENFPDQPAQPCLDCQRVAVKSDIRQFNDACRAAGGLSPGQQRILHGMLGDLKGPNGLVPYPVLVDAACDVRSQFPNR